MIEAKQNSVFPDWVASLPMQQQSVLYLAGRGPDGVRKNHPMKCVQRAYRASILKAAKLGRELTFQDRGDTFMSFECLVGNMDWSQAIQAYFAHIDELPHHFHMHLMHGAQILGYKHPNVEIRERWNKFYKRCAYDAHLNVETEEDMDKRLSDWNQEFWV